VNRAANIQRLQTEEFDLCIIGGGASGAGCALDAALRGLKVALIEKDDFAAGTSSKSTKLVHGGVRYLEQAFKKFDFAQLRQVRHGLEERHIVLRNAPHLARPLALFTPVFSWWEGLYFSIGLKLYDWFASIGRHRLADGEAGKDALPKSRWLTKSQTLRRMPGLSPKIHSAVLYFDGQLDDARYCLALVQSAAEVGAVVSNHLEVLDFQKNKNGNLAATLVRDGLSGEKFIVRAKLFLNCTGPFADQIRHLANPELSPRIRPSKGVHVVLPHATLASDDALLIPKTKDGRVVFAIPFEGKLLLGTTDDDYSDLRKEPILEAAEVDFLLETLQPFLSEKLENEQVKSGFGGLRPLVVSANDQIAQSPNHQTKSLVRDHEVEHDPTTNLLSLLGGKWTTYRLMAKDAVDAICDLLRISANCRTETHPLVGAAGYSSDLWKKIQAEHGFGIDISQHLAQKYGARATHIIELARQKPGLAEPILTGFPFIKAEIVYAVREEMARTLRDFLARRIRLEITDWQATISVALSVAKIMGAELGWSAAQQQNEAKAYIEVLEQFKKSADGNQ